MFPRQPPARCSLYGVEKSIYRLLRSLLVVVLRSSRGESILRRDVEKRDVDVPRDRENDSGRMGEQRRKEKARREGKSVLCYESVSVDVRICEYVCVRIPYKRYWRMHDMKGATTEVICDLEKFAVYVVVNYRVDPVVNRTTTSDIARTA